MPCAATYLARARSPALPAQRSLHGMLMGFADSVFAHQGRYWVLDYKTNHLGVEAAAYTDAALAQAMLQHRYDVQAALYMLALHRLLQSRLGQGYEPAQHLGGAMYYFCAGWMALRRPCTMRPLCWRCCRPWKLCWKR